MHQKKLQLLVSLIVLFVIQQTSSFQVNTKFDGLGSKNENASQQTSNILFQTIQMYLYLTDPSDGTILDSSHHCDWKFDAHKSGCGDYAPSEPAYSDGAYDVSVDDQYLPDVLPREMNILEIPPAQEALKAQAVAAPTVASYKMANGPWDDGHGEPLGVLPEGAYARINNSKNYQVYTPNIHNWPSYSEYSSEIMAAVNDTRGQFIQFLIGGHHAIDAEFRDDLGSETPDSGDLIDFPYLKGIIDPICQDAQTALRLA